MRLKGSSQLYTDAKFLTVCQANAELGRTRVSHRIRRPVFKRIYRIMGLFFMLLSASTFGQPIVYDDFEGHKVVYYIEKTGVLDTMAANPSPDKTNNSATCALYVRNASKKFDNIKMKLYTNLADVSPYATYLGVPPKLKMKIYTTAPAGTLIEILLANRGRNNDYPAGTNSQYQAYTTTSKTWEELEFKFSQIPQGSETSTMQVDQVVLLFNPNSGTSDTYYFDDITGPGLMASENIAKPEKEIKKPERLKKEKSSKKITSK